MTIQTAVLIETLAALGAECAGRPATSSPPRTTPPPRSSSARTAPPRTRRASRLRLEGRDARGVLVVHRAGARLARRQWPEHDPRRRRRRHAAASTRARVREGRRRSGLDRESDSEESGHPQRCRSVANATDAGRRSRRITGVTEETTTGVTALYEMQATARCSSRRSTSTTRSPRASSTTSTAAATRSSTASCARPTCMLGGKVAVVCGLRRRRQGLRAVAARPGRRVIVTEIDPICALQAAMDGYQVAGSRTSSAGRHLHHRHRQLQTSSPLEHMAR